MRVFVEVDHIVEFKCLDATIELKAIFGEFCQIQICAFAQHPIFSGPDSKQDRSFWQLAIERPEVEVIGTTPYVEGSNDLIRSNYKYAVDQARRLGKHLDLHLDYNIDKVQPIFTNGVLEYVASEGRWDTASGARIVLSHCTRLTLLSKDDWNSLSSTIKANDIPISFVGLPSSDLFIQGKPPPDAGGGERTRGTLQIPQIIDEYGINGAIAINNLGNAFTPQGPCDPLALASWGVGVYQAGATRSVECLFECISGRAKEAIGFEHDKGVFVGSRADLIIYKVATGHKAKLSEQRPRLTLQDLIYDPPKARQVVSKGGLVSA